MSNTTRNYELAVHAFSDDLYRYAYWLTGNATEAEDLVQECFTRAWKKWHTLKDEKAVKQWLIVILRREFYRRKRKTGLIEFIEDHEMPELPDRQSMLDEVYAIRQALHQAPPSLREPLLLQVLGGFSCEEIAQIENTSTGAVMTRLTRARQWFRSFLKPQQEVTR